ncbi:NodT family efflux transporter outer membrane factor (OMF) lipoprotein [Sphingomonas sp. PP-F2F-A104-K0414]|uniref:efflux transporter outer membrane subunit n=1 Tax=Sphingomonas sp. PP-F2F-A104-K0414 TaxID=2135661 RepID=UPI0010508CBA|nr:efflux transporter outer membrane subunit [Sphingomonas sp. PP-F2F-A104-K0414]TCQ00408.1 NodT family efflux transporter outer membrane factor (OMF) lipoprotein [Sphingomonas sp. PP-F2F-A104-K0414]
MHDQKRSWAPLLLAVALASCTVGPNFAPPAAILPPVWQSAAPVSASTDARWWRSFDDPVLDALEARAGSANLDIAAVIERITAVRIERGQARAAGAPQVEGQAGYSRERIGTAGIASVTQTLLGVTPTTTPPKGVDFDLYSAGVGASWELDLWGSHRRHAEAAQASVEAIEAAARGVRLSVEAEVARTYFQLRGLSDERRIAQDGVALAERNATITRALLTRGLATPIDVAATEEKLRALHGDIVELDHQAATTQRALAILVGGTPDTAPFDRTTLRPQSPLPAAAVRVPSEVARTRPDIVEAEARLHAATAQIGVAHADFYPKISLTGLFDIDVLNLADFGWNARSTSIGPSLSLPIFSGGRLQRQLDLRRSEERSAALAYRQTVLNAWREVDDALSASRAAADRTSLFDRDLASRRRTVAMVEARYARGDIAASPLLDARQAALSAELAIVRQRVATALAHIQLHRALGG